MKIIIFDFNRTLFNPDTGRLIYGSQETLKRLNEKGFMLILLTRKEKEPEEIIKNKKIKKYFNQIIIVDEKKEQIFRDIIAEFIPNLNQSFVIGDRVRIEISLGKKAGFRTIWLKNGKFADEIPLSADQIPDFTIYHLHQIMEIV